MSTHYRLIRKASARDLFDGRLEEYGIHEHIEPGVTEENWRCLTDDENYFWVLIDDDAFVLNLTRCRGNAPEKILNAIADAFDTDIASDISRNPSARQKVESLGETSRKPEYSASVRGENTGATTGTTRGGSSNQRFVLDDRRGYIIDTLHPANSVKHQYYFLDEPYDERNLRHSVLMMRLRDIIDKLINPTMQEHPRGEVDQLRDTIGWAIWNVIDASHLDTFDPVLSIQHESDDKIRRQKEGAQDYTSLSLFRDDVERLLRDLYGDIDSKALDRVLSAVFYIVLQLTRYVRADLWKEQEDAKDFDYMLEIGVPEGFGVGGSDLRRGMNAGSSLISRVREVNSNPLAFGEYTVKFANWFAKNWVRRIETAFEARPFTAEEHGLPF